MMCSWYIIFSCCRHWQRRHITVYQDYLKEKEKPTVNQSSPTGYLPSTSGSASAAACWSKTYDSLHPKQKLVTDSLVQNVIICCGLPVSIVDNPNFKQFLSDIDSKYNPSCRRTVTNSLLPKLLCDMKNKLQNLLDVTSDVSLTADIWTDRRTHSFLGVTVHVFLSGKPKLYLLAFRTFEGSHTGHRIADELETIMDEFKIVNKTRLIVTDNAANMKRALCILFSDFRDNSPIFYLQAAPSICETNYSCRLLRH